MVSPMEGMGPPNAQDVAENRALGRSCVRIAAAWTAALDALTDGDRHAATASSRR
jgi:hypothetical protein